MKEFEKNGCASYENAMESNIVKFQIETGYVTTNDTVTAEVVYEKECKYFDYDVAQVKELLQTAKKKSNSVRVRVNNGLHLNIFMYLWKDSAAITIKQFDEEALYDETKISIINDTEAIRIIQWFLSKIKPFIIRTTSVISDVNGVVRVNVFEDVFSATDFFLDKKGEYMKMGLNSDENITVKGDWCAINGIYKLCITTEVF